MQSCSKRRKYWSYDGNFKYLLKTQDGIDRPAIASSLPNIKGKGTTVLDLGANVDCNETAFTICHDGF